MILIITRQLSSFVAKPYPSPSSHSQTWPCLKLFRSLLTLFFNGACKHLFTESPRLTRQPQHFPQTLRYQPRQKKSAANSQISLTAMPFREMLLERFPSTACWISLITRLNLIVDRLSKFSLYPGPEGNALLVFHLHEYRLGSSVIPNL